MPAAALLAILQPQDTADIVAAVRWADDADGGVGIRGGGHSVAGHLAPDGALLVDLSTWRGAEVDPAGRTAFALAGSRLMDLDAATAASGLAAPPGTFVDTGIGGLTLGGGISFIVASEGFACDALFGAELVTAAGELVDVDAPRPSAAHLARSGRAAPLPDRAITRARSFARASLGPCRPERGSFLDGSSVPSARARLTWRSSSDAAQRRPPALATPAGRSSGPGICPPGRRSWQARQPAPW